MTLQYTLLRLCYKLYDIFLIQQCYRKAIWLLTNEVVIGVEIYIFDICL